MDLWPLRLDFRLQGICASGPDADPIPMPVLRANHLEARYHMSAHNCHWPKCGKEVHPRLFCCLMHWRQLPAEIRGRIKGAYREGQELDRLPSREYVTAARDARAWMLTAEGAA